MKRLEIGFLRERCKFLYSVDAVRNYVEEFQYMDRSMDLYFGDLSKFSDIAQNVLLKFIEESRNNIVCYASVDNIKGVLLSRFDKVDKRVKYKVGGRAFKDYIYSVEEGGSDSSKLMLSVCGGSFVEYMIHRNLRRSVGKKVGALL